MAKVTFTSLKLKAKEESSNIVVNGQTIEVKHSISSKDKYDLIMITLQESLEDKVYNPFKLDIFFALNVVYLYTNLSFTDKQKEDATKLYDILNSNGVIDMIIKEIPKEEWDELYNAMISTKNEYVKWSQSAAGMIDNVIKDLPATLNEASETLDNFNLQEYQDVISFAKSVNGDNPVPGLSK